MTTHAVQRRMTPLIINMKGINGKGYDEASTQMASSATEKK
jgi:hypothetical protein